MPLKHLLAFYAAPRIAILILILSSIQAHSTATVVIATSDGIVIATDTKIALVTRAQTIGQQEGVKAFVIKDRFAVACLGEEFFTFATNSGQSIHYEFGAWIHGIESGLPQDASFDAFVGAVKGEISNMVPKLQPVLSGGGMHQESPLEKFEVFVDYVIAGYQNGAPRLTVLQLYIDWNNKRFVGPYQIPILADGPITGHTYLYPLGVTQAVADVRNPKSYAYKEAMTCCAKALKNLIANQLLTLDESEALAKVLVGVEEKTNPDVVGGRVRVVEVPSFGRARDLLNDSLPKAPARKGQQKQ